MEGSPSQRPPRRSSIRLRALGLLGAVLVVLVATEAAGSRTFQSFAELGKRREVIAHQQSLVRDVELLLLRCLNGAPALDELHEHCERFGRTLAVLREGGALGQAAGDTTLEAPEDEPTRAALGSLGDGWRVVRAGIEAVLEAAHGREQECAHFRGALPTFMAELAGLQRALTVADLEDAGDVAGDLRGWSAQMQRSMTDLETQLRSEVLEQAMLALEVTVERSQTALAALAEGSEELELEAIQDSRCLEPLVRAGRAFEPVVASTSAASRAVERLHTKLAEVTGGLEALQAEQDELSGLVAGQSDRELEFYRDLRRMVLIGVACMILAFALYLQRALLAPLTRLRDLLRDIAGGEGDLTRVLAVDRNDELGEAAASFNAFVAKLRVLVRDLARSVSALVECSSKVRVVSGSLGSAVAETETKACEVITGVGSIDHDLGQVVQQAEDMTRCSEAILESCEVTSREVLSSVELSKEVRGNVSAMARTAEEIAAVLAAIETISGRVGLLALNSSIQATHAGAAGKGFEVIAREVRDLAGQTETQTALIGRTISKLTDVCRRSSESFAEVDRSILRIQERQGAASSTAGEQVRRCSDVAALLGGARGSSASVRAGSERLKSLVTDSTEAARHTHETAEALDRLSGSLRSIVSQFRY